MEKVKVLILTPDLNDEMYNGRWREILCELTDCLSKYNILISNTSWTDDLDKYLGKVDIVLPLLAWGYQREYERWIVACKKWKDLKIPISPSADILQWNANKTYLNKLSDSGVQTVPTLYFDTICESKLRYATEYFGSKRVVLKPTISATAYKTSIWEKGMPILDAPTDSCMVQPFLSNIVSEGEISLIFINRKFSHALKKKPKSGDFRVQPEFGGEITAYAPTPNSMDVAKMIVDSIDGSLLYARIDLVQDQDKQWKLLEAELIEPDLYLAFDKEDGKLLAQEIKDIVAINKLI
ncbi:hypothetical protein JKP31_20175 [Vibrio vulnificus]|uniref:ATP-grasp domain-containing protein n=1 Tax=Vibrio vulnificus TaxID=672 RepID=UPI001CDBFDED|nr:hypothetical protein [Vibrio vulnificus]MCA3903600.1 hypothetical protein [Vibrio vulnificus]